MQTQDLSILIADDHKMVRSGLRLMLSLQTQQFNFLISEAEDGEQAIDKAIKKDFDIILLDYNMPYFNGDAVINRILMHKPKAKIMVLSSYDEKGFITSCVSNGAKSYMLKSIETPELMTAIDTVRNGGTYFQQNISDKMNEVVHESTSTGRRSENDLSKRQIEILSLLTNEYTNDEIATKLGISKRTVDTHRQNLLGKLKVKNTAGLIKYAIQHHIGDD